MAMAEDIGRFNGQCSGRGAQNLNRSSEMRRQTDTVAQKMLLEQGGGTQNANRLAEMKSLVAAIAHTEIIRAVS